MCEYVLSEQLSYSLQCLLSFAIMPAWLTTNAIGRETLKIAAACIKTIVVYLVASSFLRSEELYQPLAFPHLIIGTHSHTHTHTHQHIYKHRWLFVYLTISGNQAPPNSPTESLLLFRYVQPFPFHITRCTMCFVSIAYPYRCTCTRMAQSNDCAHIENLINYIQYP